MLLATHFAFSDQLQYATESTIGLVNESIAILELIYVPYRYSNQTSKVIDFQMVSYD